MNSAEAFDLLRSLDLPLGDYAVFGSGPLLARGIIEHANDIDIIARDAAWEQALEQGELNYLPEEDVTIASFFGGLVGVGVSWAYGEVAIDDLIDTAELYNGVPFVLLDHVITYKQIAGRDKDHAHLERIEQWQRTHHV